MESGWLVNSNLSDGEEGAGPRYWGARTDFADCTYVMACVTRRTSIYNTPRLWYGLRARMINRQSLYLIFDRDKFFWNVAQRLGL